MQVKDNSGKALIFLAGMVTICLIAYLIDLSGVMKEPIADSPQLTAKDSMQVTFDYARKHPGSFIGYKGDRSAVVLHYYFESKTHAQLDSMFRAGR